MATLALNDPDGSARELERAVKDLNFKGAMVLINMSDHYIDRPTYWKIYAKAEELKVPIYIHPAQPMGELYKPFQDYPPLATAVFGYGIVAGLQAMRMMYSGLFDEYPHLQIILGHLGEALPYWSWRLDNRFMVQRETYQLQVTLSIGDLKNFQASTLKKTFT